jgi:hypothetical protein
VRAVFVAGLLELAQDVEQVPVVPDQGAVQELMPAVGLEYTIVAVTCFPS